MMGGNRGDKYIQRKRGHTSSIAVRFMFSEQRFQLTQSWKEEGFGSLDHALRMCEIMDISTYRTVRLACSRSLKVKYNR